MPQRLLLLLCLFVCHAKMQGTDTLSVPLHYYLWQSDENILINLGIENPAIRHFFPPQQYTQITLQTTASDYTKLHFTHQGDAVAEHSGEAIGHTRGSKSTLFGTAAYHMGHANHVQWSHSEDHHRIGPYSVADSTTGNKQYETYLLQGGLAWSIPVGVIGLSANYHAQSTYRTKNPRSYSVISDFSLTAGWAVPIRNNYLVALSAQYGNYNQNLDVSNMPNDRKDLFYFLYGYGMYNQNISGTGSNFSVDYKGQSYGTSVQLLPLFHQGWFLSARQHHETMDALYASRPRGSYQNNQQQLSTGHHWHSTTSQHRAGLSLKHQSGTGTEYYYEQVVVDTITTSSESRLLSKSSKYIQTESSFSLFLKSYINNGPFKINPNIEAGMQAYNSKYKTTPYNEEVKNWFVLTGVELYKINGTNLSGIGFSVACHHTISDQLIVPSDNRIIQNTLLIDHQFRVANKLTAQISAQHLGKLKNNNTWRVKAGFNLLKAKDKIATGVNISLAMILH